MPTIRLGGEQEPWSDGDGPGATARLRSRQVTIGDVPTRAVSADGEGRRPCSCTAGSTTPTPGSRCSIGSRSPGARRSPTTCPGSARRRRWAPGRCSTSSSSSPPTRSRRRPSESGCKVVVAGNSLGGWTALRLAERSDLPLAGVVAIGPAGIKMAPAFFTLDRVPAVSRIIGLPAPVPPAVVRSVAGSLYRRLAFADPAGVDQAVVDRFTRFHVERGVIRDRIDYAKRLRDELEDPFDAERSRSR